jgi:L-aminopeptidase/D-esterase-like protein
VPPASAPSPRWTRASRRGPPSSRVLTNRAATLVPRTGFDGRTLDFDFPGIALGVAEYDEGPTGCTVFAFARGWQTAIDKRGGLVGIAGEYDFNHAIVFAGGSLYGLEAAAGVAAELNFQRGYDLQRMALVSCAIIWDFGRPTRVYPDAALGAAALRVARPGAFPLGRCGAGRAASCGAVFGRDRAEPAGQGGGFRQVGATKLGAFVVVNALGVVLDRQGRVVLGNRDPATGERRHPVEEYERRLASGAVPAPPGGNTTLTLIVTNQRMDRRELTQWARQVHASMGRAIYPFQTLADGDTLFAVTTNEVDSSGLDVAALGVVAGELVWDALLTVAPTS